MSLVHNMNEQVAGATQALAELHKAGFIQDVAFRRYAVSNPVKHNSISYESMVLSRPSKDLKLPVSFPINQSIFMDEIEIVMWKDLRGWTAIYAHLNLGWFEFLGIPIPHWAYCKKDPRPWSR